MTKPKLLVTASMGHSCTSTEDATESRTMETQIGRSPGHQTNENACNVRNGQETV